MASNMLNLSLSSTLREVTFAGDSVLLSGQMDYPQRPVPKEGFPLLFILHDAQCTTRERYIAHAQVALENGFAVFRWDKRGTGRSGASARGSTIQDAVNAWEIALSQPSIQRRRAVILANGAGTGVIGSAFGLFARIQRPYAVGLIASALDETAILAIDAPVHIVMSADDWNDPARYATAAANAHNASYPHGATYAVVPGADRLLLDEHGSLYPEAREAVSDWLNDILHPSPSI
ncbi:hypothetical protein FBR02_15240 [Anaerolineae bacterium CFX9]|nr:hypothetical protein [Anaerolineae bacterium CFX9]